MYEGNRRSFNRLVLRGKVVLGFSEYETAGVMLNISAGGMFVLGVDFSAGREVEVAFSLDDVGMYFSCRAVVVWSRPRGAARGFYPPGVALKFLDMDPFRVKFLDRYVSTARSLNSLDTRIGFERKRPA